jgi:hypothetical protein
VLPEGLGKVKKFNSSGSRTRDLRGFSIVPVVIVTNSLLFFLEEGSNMLLPYVA